MSISAGITLLIILLAVGTLIFARTGIRSLQSARKVVFYRTRRTRTLVGWQSLALSFILLIFAVSLALFGEPLVRQYLPSMPLFAPSPTWTALPIKTSVPSSTETDLPATGTPSQTLEASPTSSETGPTATLDHAAATSAVSTVRRETFIAALSVTPTSTRTPIPNWTRTSTSTPRPTWTASPTRTLRPTATPTLTPTSTYTPRPTWTTTPTRTLIPTSTLSPTLAPTPVPTRTLWSPLFPGGR